MAILQYLTPYQKDDANQKIQEPFQCHFAIVQNDKLLSKDTQNNLRIFILKMYSKNPLMWSCPEC